MTLRLGLPKGQPRERDDRPVPPRRLQDHRGERSYFPAIDDPDIECMLVRAQEMARYVEDGALDCGLTGRDWVVENEADGAYRDRLVYAKQSFGQVRWVLAVPDASPVTGCGPQGKIVATELVGVDEALAGEAGVTAKVEFSWGATEAKLPQLADAIVEVTETGSSLRANKLRVVDTVLERHAVHRQRGALAGRGKRRKIEDIVLLLQGAMPRSDKVGLMLNVRAGDLDAVLAVLPALRKPTISHLSDAELAGGQHDPRRERMVREIIPRLKEAGARGHRGVPAEQDRDVDERQGRRRQARGQPARWRAATRASRSFSRPYDGSRSCAVTGSQMKPSRSSPSGVARPCTKRHAVSAAARASSESWSKTRPRPPPPRAAWRRARAGRRESSWAAAYPSAGSRTWRAGRPRGPPEPRRAIPPASPSRRLEAAPAQLAKVLPAGLHPGVEAVRLRRHRPGRHLVDGDAAVRQLGVAGARAGSGRAPRPSRPLRSVDAHGHGAQVGDPGEEAVAVAVDVVVRLGP